MPADRSIRSRSTFSTKTMSGKNKGPLICVLTLAFLFMALYPISAELDVKPPSFILEMPSGATRTKVLTVTNTGKEEIKVSLKVADWFRNREGDLQILPPGTRERSCADWIVFSPSELTLDSEESVKVTVEISVPDKETKGDHWAMILVNEEAKEIELESPVRSRPVDIYAIKILVQKQKPVGKSGKITKVSLEEADPLTLSIEFKNTGMTHLQTTGTVELRNLQGETVESFQVDKFPALPGEVREIKVTTNSDNKLERGQYYAIAVFNYGGEHRVQGGRTIFLSLPFGSSDAPPRDLDGDGLYEDVNGDGELTSDDSSALALNLDAEVVKNSPSLFDFNDDGEVSFEDASKLMEMVEQKKRKEK